MAISPKSKGLGNIGSIVNRQGLASPTKPAAKMPVAKMPVAKPVMAKPAAPARPNTTTFAQRQAAPSPFRSATKPMAKVNPMTGQPVDQQMPMQPAPQPFNPNPNPGQQPFTFDNQRFNPVPELISDPIQSQILRNPDGTVYQGLGGPLNQVTPMPGSSSGIVDLGNGMSIVPDFGGTFIDPNIGLPSTGPAISNDFGPGEMINQYGFPGMSNQPIDTQGGGIFGGNLPGMVGNAVGQGLSGLFGNIFGGNPNADYGIYGQVNEGAPSVFTNQLNAGILPPNNPNADYGGLNSAFNPQSNNNQQGGFMSGNSSGSLFGAGGFADNG